MKKLKMPHPLHCGGAQYCIKILKTATLAAGVHKIIMSAANLQLTSGSHCDSNHGIKEEHTHAPQKTVPTLCTE